MVESKNNNNNAFDLIKNDVVQIELTDQFAFSRIVEVLTRIGIPSYKTHSLYQTAHILHKRGKYYIVHFKDMFILDGKQATLTADDVNRVKTIAKLLQQWGLCKIVDKAIVDEMQTVPVLVIPRSELSQWTLVPKYNIGHYNKN